MILIPNKSIAALLSSFFITVPVVLSDRFKERVWLKKIRVDGHSASKSKFADFVFGILPPRSKLDSDGGR